jgi:SAM-dependent methyltransferase
MSYNTTNAYDIEPHIAEIYDQVETCADDVALIRRLIGGRGPLRILEPFCGTGRILIPLALDGHTLVGLDQSKGMLDRARTKIAQLPEAVHNRITLAQADVISDPWPQGFDLVILGGNCFYELATPQEQEGCIISAAAALNPGGHVYVDNDHMEGELDKSWQNPGCVGAFPPATAPMARASRPPPKPSGMMCQVGWPSFAVAPASLCRMAERPKRNTSNKSIQSVQLKFSSG